MDNLGTIIKSWALYIQGSNFTKQLIGKRIAICAACPHCVVYGTLNTCGLCGCPLSGKTANPDNSCPAKPKRWNKVVEESYF